MCHFLAAPVRFLDISWVRVCSDFRTDLAGCTVIWASGFGRVSLFQVFDMEEGTTTPTANEKIQLPQLMRRLS